jgi:hypothetical protein
MVGVAHLFVARRNREHHKQNDFYTRYSDMNKHEWYFYLQRSSVQDTVVRLVEKGFHNA